MEVAAHVDALEDAGARLAHVGFVHRWATAYVRTGCDVRVRGTAHDLYLLLWRRRSAEGLGVSGTAAALEHLMRRRGVTWQ